ncbi:MAG: hypothetical protein ACI93R_000563 [Flavobacteriales bacterium]|jgi:hypothetical protein
MAHTIDYTIKTLTSLQEALEAGYWDSSDMHVKDRVFDLYSIINDELAELAKLSVNDLDLEFEPATDRFSGACKKFGLLMGNVDDWFVRTTTATQLKSVLPIAALLVSKECQI